MTMSSFFFILWARGRRRVKIFNCAADGDGRSDEVQLERTPPSAQGIE